MPEGPSYTCPQCRLTSYHPQDVKYRYCSACYKFEDGVEPDPGSCRPDDTYCVKCDVFGHMEDSPACEFYYARWETTNVDDKKATPQCPP